MRTIKIPADVLAKAIAEGRQTGRAMLFVVQVDWPELRLTEAQIMANAAWAAAPHRTTPRPFPDHSIFDIEIPFISRAAIRKARP